MFQRLTHQVTAFSLAAALTLGILGTINLLAEQPAAVQLASAAQTVASHG